MTRHRIAEPWQEIESSLPAKERFADVRAALELIRGDAEVRPRDRVAKHEARAALCARLVKKLAGENPELVAALRQQADADKDKAALYRRVGKVKRKHFIRQCEILEVWRDAGGKLTVYQHGPHIAFFQAASLIVFGKRPTPRQIKIILRDYFRAYHVKLHATGGLKIDEAGITVISGQ